MRVQCLVAKGARVQSVRPVPALPTRFSVLPVQLPTPKVLDEPSGLRLGAVAVLPPPPTYRHPRPRSFSFVPPEEALKMAPENGIDPTGENAAPPQLVVPAVVVNESRVGQPPPGAVVLVVLLAGVVVDDDVLVLVVGARLVLVVLATVVLLVTDEVDVVLATVLLLVTDEVVVRLVLVEVDVLVDVLVLVVCPGQRQFEPQATKDPPGLDGGHVRLPGGSQPSPGSIVPLPQRGAVLEVVEVVVVTETLEVVELVVTVVVVLAGVGQPGWEVGLTILKLFAPGAGPLAGLFWIEPPAAPPNDTQ